ncbi:HD domain-containing protein [Rubrobacter tropicus]|uniref:HD domain-containing protein n=1 Tax=Rubrobacter tropicus TaxID=2653851 RepID=A0A6G8Q4A4_9ACTN|nr:HD domain-containing protein [Rubrobacter tropicus]QIN81324.1 HD domain-containing protein [Rubrobacter tropicus]
MEASEANQKILAALRAAEHLPYDGEAVGQLQHALQCADLARCCGHGPEVVVAALLHDVGRSPVALRDLRAAGVTGGEHGALAGAWLRPLVGERVAWLAEQHVPAKRYLVATDPSYERSLSGTSRRTLEVQGGPMSPEEVAGFEGNPGWRDAAELRRWDDLAKDPDAETPPLEDFEEELWFVVSEHFGGRRLSGQSGIGYGTEDAQ